MALESPRMAWAYPAEGTDPWFDAFETLIGAQDASAYAAREDRNILVLGGGTVAWDALTGVLSWSANIELTSTISGFLVSIPAGSETIAEGRLAYLILTRAPVAPTSAALVVADNTPNTNDAVVFALRRGSTLYFRNGRTINDGEAIEVFTASSVAFDDTLFVHKAGSETITGVKTFSASPLVPAPIAAGNPTPKSYVDALDANNVKLTGAQTVAGIKSFTSSPVVPTPTLPTDAANKAYVDGLGGGASASVQTVNATPTTLYTQTIAASEVHTLEVTVTAYDLAGVHRASYVLVAQAHRPGAGAAVVGTVTVVHQQETDPAWDVNVVASGNDALVRVTGAAATTINWQGRIRSTFVGP